MNNLNNLELLGERVFATLDEARAAVDSQLQDEGFVLTIKHTRSLTVQGTAGLHIPFAFDSLTTAQTALILVGSGAEVIPSVRLGLPESNALPELPIDSSGRSALNSPVDNIYLTA
ncbi:hypothetical protein AXG93_4182s1370 [Marchantia polymorpha subsp. ruderalis]|uniref:Uncharacterized protein n=1 Tax=Marchantia polymorpha subsp. ruderalis TaxID=1480154 RepID=A0A176VE78_MARPO|nr:hypothetical protein AXG93_4182s1370 [Marchantia polymorpha subsp. ruderalis]